MSNAVFEQLQAQASDGPSAILDCLIDQLRADKQYHELFQALQMQIRLKQGLPPVRPDDEEDLSEEQRLALEEHLIDACREVGMALLKGGQVREAWMFYLRAVGNNAEVAAELENVEVDDENLDELVEVALYEGVAPQLGFGLVLEHYGTCNSITTFESSMHQHRMSDQQAAAGMLVKHVHEELSATVRADIAQQEGEEPKAATLKELVEDRDWLFGEHSYHIDTTHLASTVRFARIVTDPEVLTLALDLTAYGRHLSTQFQYDGEEPFEDLYPSHSCYFQAVLGASDEEAQAGLDYFRDKAQSVDVQEHGAVAIETYISLLYRTKRYDEAITATRELLDPNRDFATGSAPSLLEIAQASGNFDYLLEQCRERNDVLGFATGLLVKP